MEFLKSWLEHYSIASHHINSFLEWQHFGLKNTILSQTITTKLKKWKFVNVKFQKPDYTFLEAKIDSKSFAAKIFVDIEEITLQDFSSIILRDVEIAQVPMMIMPDDEGSDGIGGYFFINNIERVLITQIRFAYNQPIVSKTKLESKKNRVKTDAKHGQKFEKDNLEFEQFCETFKNVYSKNVDIVESVLTFRSISEVSNHSCAIEMVLTQQDQILLNCSKFKGRISVGLVLKALGCITRKDFLWASLGDQELADKLYYDNIECKSQIEALEILSSTLEFVQKTIEGEQIDVKDVLRFLTFEIFPHLGFSTTPSIVCVYIVSLVSKLYNKNNETKLDDKDSLIFKRFEPAGALIHDLFEQLFKKWISNLTKFCEKKNNIIMGIQKTFLTKRILYCFSTGTWGALMSNYKRMGVSQPRCYNSWISSLCHLQRISNPISKETRNQPVRQLHTSHQFYLCSVQSPEGKNVGLVTNMAIGARITTKSNYWFILDALNHLIKPINFGGQELKFLLSINGRLIGHVEDPERFFVEFFYQRRIGRFDNMYNHGMCSIGIVKNHIFIWTDEGRITRMVKNVDNIGNFKQAFDNGHVEWLDPFEQEYGFRKHSLQREIHFCTSLGLSACTIPFLNFQPVPRSVYASNMNIQSVSTIGPKQTEIFSTTINLKRWVDKPLVDSTCSQLFKIDQYPTGVNVIVAICPIDGFNQEDAVVLNKSSVQRGLFDSDVYKTHFLTEEANKKFGLPNKKIRNKYNNYCLLDQDGIVRADSFVYEGDVLVGIVSENCDVSLCVEKQEEGFVHQVFKKRINDLLHVKIVLVSKLELTVGDKLCSRFSQKGVVGAIVDSWDLPFLPDGTVPDIFVNPLCIPSRMTVSTILEGLFGLYALKTSQFIHLEPFAKLPNIRQELKKLGIDPSGNQVFLHPKTGREMVPLFVAPMYFQKLPHFAIHKAYARARGIVAKSTRQPTDGRSRGGGLRIGEMERDALIGLNLSHILEDRLFFSSDEFYIFICQKCKNVALNGKVCLCGGSETVRVKCAFTNNLIFNQLKAMGCMIKFET